MYEELCPIAKGGKNENCRVSFPESVYIYLEGYYVSLYIITTLFYIQIQNLKECFELVLFLNSYYLLITSLTSSIPVILNSITLLSTLKAILIFRLIMHYAYGKCVKVNTSSRTAITVNPLYNDFRYISKIRWSAQKSVDCVFFIDIPILFFRKTSVFCIC